MLARASNRESAAILAIVLVGASLVVTGRLPAQMTHTFSSVVELENGFAAGDAVLIDERSIALTLMAPGLDLDWVEIRDRERGGTVLATTRSRNRRPPLLEILGMGDLLNDPAGGSVGVGFEDYLVEFTLHAPGGGLGRSPKGSSRSASRMASPPPSRSSRGTPMAAR